MNLDKVVKYSVPLFVLAIVSRSIEEISFIYYAVPVMSLLFIVLMFRSSKSSSLSRTGFGIKDQDYKVDRETSLRQSPESEIEKRSDSLFAALKRMTPLLLFIIPGLWFLLTSLWSSYPEISAARALYFTLISLGCISAGILWIKYSDNNIFDFLLPANVVIVLIALFSLITNIPSDSWTGGHGKGFMGFFGHQNLLASVVLFTLPSVFVKLLQPVISDQLSVISNTREKKSYKYLPLTAYCLLFTANLLLLTLTYSRASILALVIGTLVFLILNKNWKVLVYGALFTAIIVIAIYSIPSLNQTVDKIIKKDFPEVYSSRLWMWEPSYKAALEGGLFGLGYGISHPEIRSGEYSDRFENGRLIREKGNSTLALIEEAGVIGLVLFLLPIIYAVRKFIIYNVEFRMRPFDKLRVTNHSLLTAALAAFLLHAQFEAWWVGVGSVQLPLFYIYIGLLVQSLIVRGSRVRG